MNIAFMAFHLKANNVSESLSSQKGLVASDIFEYIF
jgi:hypothetical protein